MKVLPEMDNLNGTLHGGAITSIIDVCTTMAIMSLDTKNRANVSADLSISFVRGGSLNTEIFILSQVDKLGKQLAFSNACVYNNTFNLIASGKHLKAFLEDQIYHFDGQNITYPKK